MRLLVVDDEILAVEAVKKCLDYGQFGISEVLSAYSMKQAQEILECQTVEIVLCDIEMPNGSGLELISWINSRFPEIVTIILSCHTEFSFAQKAVSLSCMEYILKPATPDVLSEALSRAIGKYSSQHSQEKMAKIGKEYVHKVTDTQEEVSAVRQVQDYIMKHIDEELSVTYLAQMVYLSQNHLTRCFKKETGKTVLEYIADYRISMAEELLRTTSLSVTQIGAKVGYPNYAYFTRIFKKYTGQTPSEYRSK